MSYNFLIPTQHSNAGSVQFNWSRASRERLLHIDTSTRRKYFLCGDFLYITQFLVKDERVGVIRNDMIFSVFINV